MENDKTKEFTSKDGKIELEKGYKKAEEIINDEDKMEKFLNRLEKKLNKVPIGGNVLSMIPVMISMLRSYFKKEYKNIPLGTLIALVSALLYWLTPADVIPDVIPIAGYVDDATVITACIKLISDDIKEYKKFKESNKYEE